MILSYRALALIAGLATALPAAAIAETPLNWGIDCSSKEQCTIGLGLDEAGTGKRVISFIALVRPEQSELTVGAAIALGVALLPGMKLGFGDTTVDAAYDVCFPDGCRALATLNAAQTEALLKATSMEVRYFPFSSERPVAITVPLTGLADQVAKARSELAAK